MTQAEKILFVRRMIGDPVKNHGSDGKIFSFQDMVDVLGMADYYHVMGAVWLLQVQLGAKVKEPLE